MAIQIAGNTVIDNNEVHTASGSGYFNNDGNLPFYMNQTTVNTSFTIPNGSNAVSVGPITIASGVTVTVGTGETWAVI